jgi:hypothetical protein
MSGFRFSRGGGRPRVRPIYGGAPLFVGIEEAMPNTYVRLPCSCASCRQESYRRSVMTTFPENDRELNDFALGSSEPTAQAFRPIGVEIPGGGRIRDKRAPRSTDIVTVVGVGGKRVPLHRLAALAWRALVYAARRDGIREPLLLPVSGYRDPEYQKSLWLAALRKYGTPERARQWVAPPGASAHQTGRAIDFYLGGRNSSSNVGRLRRLPAYRWLATNAFRFGFYPYVREPWHWEYNPLAAQHR